ncbi:ABC transporter G family member 24-like isoform X3 [Castanea sativa]|uniref:ABC transporter G family member 24-like isoform X3 n=1 Tax=Castanea sativa TaxID=21020 RepID=UPI003F64FD0B
MMSLRMMPRSLLPRPNITRGLKNAKLVNLEKEVCYRGDITRRLCSAAELKFYFNSFFERSGSTNYLKPNKNCNLTSWVEGCEPGWACSVGSNQKVNLNDSKVIPARTLNCQACCEGFFCPHGITCMIPCPLGSYCPLATLNKTTGVCQPYLYQLPLGNPNHTCGGANIWAVVGSSSELFCSAGSYCPSTTSRQTCTNITAGWVLHLREAALSTLLLILYNCSDQVLTARERRLAKSREAAARSARETTKARQRWRSAKDAAKKIRVEENLWFSAKCRYTPFPPCRFLLLILYAPYIVAIIFT